ncbi:MAG: hypothetical protein L6V93_02460 [Clostridiales bacterium]|nr:MAG: hypothetical protein L6V93_02460 [Clostridiales bacterium]
MDFDFDSGVGGFFAVIVAHKKRTPENILPHLGGILKIGIQPKKHKRRTNCISDGYDKCGGDAVKSGNWLSFSELCADLHLRF